MVALTERPVGDRGSARAVALVAISVVVLVGLVLTLIALTLSVVVVGDSMQPTLHPGDRIEVNPLRLGGPLRFDLVEATEPGGSARIVKRVIGLPGDEVSIRGGKHPVVLVRPHGSQTTYRVDNPSWPGQIRGVWGACCSAEGTTNQTTAWVTVPPQSYWLLGDNWGGSTDSRAFGFVTKIDATLWFRVTPLRRFGGLGNHVRLVPVSKQ